MSNEPYTNTPNIILDAMREMSDCELRVSLAVVYILAARDATEGHISLGEIQHVSGLSKQGAIEGTRAAAQRGIIRRIAGRTPEGAEHILRFKRAQMLPPSLSGTGKECEWCKCETLVLHNHHYPIPRAEGGEKTVAICPNCHTEYHILIGGMYAIGSHNE